jgi:response regulator RpfG family c-di-GMP phosphodiesterase
MLEVATTESAAPAAGSWEWAPSASPAGQRPVEDVVAAGVLLDVSRVLGGLLGLARPALGARTERVTILVRLMARALDLDRPWEFEVAARLSQIGWLTVPAEMYDAALRGDPLPDEEWCMVASHPLVARDLLAEVVRLDGVREMIARQREPFAVAGETPAPVTRRDRLMLGGQMLRVCADYVALLERGLAPGAAMDRLASQPLEIDPALVHVLSRCIVADRPPEVKS